MPSDYIRQCMLKAQQSILEMKKAGLEPSALEISSNVWDLIQLGGFNMVDEPVFAGLPVVVRTDVNDLIQAV